MDFFFFPPWATKTPSWPYLIKCYSCPDLVVYNERGKVHYDLWQSHGKHHSMSAFNLCFSLCHGSRSTLFLCQSWTYLYNRLAVGTHKAVHLEFRNTVIRPLMFKVNRELVFIWTLVTLWNNASLLSRDKAELSRKRSERRICSSMNSFLAKMYLISCVQMIGHHYEEYMDQEKVFIVVLLLYILLLHISF